MGKSQSTSRSEATFRVKFVNEKGIPVGSGSITISENKVEFISKSKKQEYEWPLTTISRYGGDEKIFTFEVVDDKGNAAMYCFTSPKVDKMRTFLDRKIKDYRKKEERNDVFK